MTLGAHIALGAAITRGLELAGAPPIPSVLGAIACAVTVHVLTDGLCAWHPAGLEWPWGFTRLLPWRWQYRVQFVPVSLMRLLWCANVVVVMALVICAPLRYIAVGLAHWLIVDFWWFARDFWPGLYSRIEGVNPHWSADRIRVCVYGEVHPERQWSMWVELILLASATFISCYKGW